MRNLRPTTYDNEDLLKNAKKGLHKKMDDGSGNEVDNPKRKILEDEQAQLLSLYNGYDALTVPCRLETLRPAYADADKRDALYSLYDRERKFLSDYWNVVSKNQDGELEYCPFCNHNVVKDLDHYIPRSIIPEYSIHLHNLIPTCSKCNLDKHNDWLDDNGNRIFFNAFYDVAPDMGEVLNVLLSIDANTYTPKVRLELRQQQDVDDSHVSIAKRTTAKLHLIELYWQNKANDAIKEVTRRLTNRIRVERRSGAIIPADFWNRERDFYIEEIATMPAFEFIKKLIYEQMVISRDFETWILGQC